MSDTFTIEPMELEQFDHNWKRSRLRPLLTQLQKLGVDPELARIIYNKLKTAHVGLAYDSYRGWVWIYNVDTRREFDMTPEIHDYCIWMALLACNELDKIKGIKIIRELFISAYILKRFQHTGIEYPKHDV